MANGGAAAARNVGLAATNSRYIALLDSDDRYLPHMLQAHIALLEGQPEVDVVYADHEVIDRNGSVTQSAADVARRARCHEMNALSQGELFASMAERNFISCVTAMFRRRCVETGVKFDETPDSIEDKVFWLSLIGCGFRFRYVNDTVAQYRRHGTNTSDNFDKLLRGRKLLYRDIPALARASVCGAASESSIARLRRTLWRHMYAEAAWGYRTQRRYMRAVLAYCLKHGYVLRSLFAPRFH